VAHVSPEGRKAIENEEGLRLQAYRNLGGVWTVGWGHTGPEVKDGFTITKEQADAFLEGDLRKFETGVEQVLGRPATQPQFDSLVSFAYNIGLEAFKTSTLLQRFNVGDTVGVVWEFRRWTQVKGVESPGLFDRRKREAKRFLEGN
jgi:lysozyme